MTRVVAVTCLVVATAGFSIVTLAAVDHVVVNTRTSFQNGKIFPGVGAYEELHGRAWFKLDPKNKANERIVDLKLAPRDRDGLVEFSTDFVLTRPIHDADSTLLCDVNNRGGQITGGHNFGLDFSKKPPFVDTNFLQRHGFSVLASAWEWDVKPENADDHPLVFTPPIATDHGLTITGKVANEFIVEAPAETASFVGIDGRSYAAAVSDDPKAVLTARANPGDPRKVVQRTLWHFVPPTDKQPPTSLFLKDGFQPGLIYKLTYIARAPYVVGTGPAGIRDLLSWFRTHPFAGVVAPKRMLVFGASQTGRLIAQMFHDGMDVDEKGETRVRRCV